MRRSCCAGSARIAARWIQDLWLSIFGEKATLYLLIAALHAIHSN